MERDGQDLAPGEDAGWLDDLTADSDALDAWEYMFAEVLDTTLEAADDSDPVVAPDLELEGHGPALVTRLLPATRRPPRPPGGPHTRHPRAEPPANLIDEGVSWGIRRLAASGVVAETLDQALAAIPTTPGDARVLAIIREQAERISRG